MKNTKPKFIVIGFNTEAYAPEEIATASKVALPFDRAIEVLKGYAEEDGLNLDNLNEDEGTIVNDEGHRGYYLAEVADNTKSVKPSPKFTYSILAFFSCGKNKSKRDELWQANFTNKEDAIKCFQLKLWECGNPSVIEAATHFFQSCLTTGSCYATYDGPLLFVRREKINSKFNRKQMAWD